MTGTWNLDPWKGTIDYLHLVQKTVRFWETFFSEGDFPKDWFSGTEVAAWMHDLRSTLEALRYQYVFNTAATLSVDPRSSGFPEHVHIHRLGGAQMSGETASPAQLKRAALDDLFKTKRINFWFLEEIAKANVRQLLATQRVLAPFRVRSLQKLGTGESGELYRLCFERYCFRNLPSLYLLHFEHQGDLSPELVREMHEILEKETSSLPLLGGFARRLDQAIAPIKPVWIGRVSIGPLFIAHLTQDEHALQAAVNAYADTHVSCLASRIIYEYVMADGSSRTERLHDALGRKHDSIQEFAIRVLDDECAERQVSAVSKFLFAPHRIAQALDEEFRQSISHQLITTE